MHRQQYCLKPAWAFSISAFVFIAPACILAAPLQLQPQFETTPDPYYSINETVDQKPQAKTSAPATITWNKSAPPAVNPPVASKYSKTEFPEFNPRGPLTTGLVPSKPLLTNSPELDNQIPANSIIREQKQFAAPTRMPPSHGSSAFQPMNPKDSLPKSNLQEKATTDSPARFDVGQTSATSEIKSEAVSFEPGQVLALVGGYPVFVGDLLFETNQMIQQFMPQASPTLKEQERKKIIPKMLPKYVEAKLLYVSVIQSLPEGADFEQVLAQAEEQFDKSALPEMLKKSGLKSQNELDANLRAMGSSLRQHRKSWAEEQITKYFLGQQLRKSKEITHQEMLDVYRENIKDYENPAKCIWEQIVIRFDRSESREAAEQTIVALGNDIVFGGNFAAVAKASSHGFKAANGGRYDWTTKGSLASQEIDEFIFSAPVGDLSDIIETKIGFHIVRVIKRTDASRTPFLEAQTAIKKQIQSAQSAKAYQEHLAKIKKQIPVEYFINED